MARHQSTLETIGHTPFVRINHLAPAHVSLCAVLGEMTEDEQAVFRSTPFGLPPTQA
jgi:hypothetical protein